MAEKRKSVLQTLKDRDYPELKKRIDSSIEEDIFEPLMRAGHPNLATAAGTIAGTAADYLTPESDAEMAMALIPLPISKLTKLRKEGKILSKLRDGAVPASYKSQAGRVAREINTEARAGRAVDNITEQFPDILEEGEKAGLSSETLEYLTEMGAHNPDLMLKLSNPDNNYRILNQIATRKDPADQIKLINDLNRSVLSDIEFRKMNGK